MLRSLVGSEMCIRDSYKRTVKLFDESRYEFEVNVFAQVVSFDSMYICYTCDRHLSKKEIPCQAVWNKLCLYDLICTNYKTPAVYVCFYRQEKNKKS